MREMIKRVREERGGFTLAELLIVVAIILVLVAVAVPVFTGAMDSANRSVGYAAGHAVKSEASAKYLLDNNVTDKTVAKYYQANVDHNGNVTDLAETTAAGTYDATNLDDAQALALGKAISTNKTAATTVTVKIEGSNLTPTA